MSSTDEYESIAALFHQRIDTIVGAVDAMANGLQSAAQICMQAVMNDSKLLLVGCSEDTALAEYAAGLFRAPTDGTPPIPAVAITGEANQNPDASVWKDLRTLSRDGDVLIALDSLDLGITIQHSIAVAKERNLVSISLSEQMETGANAEILLAAPDPLQRRELALMALHTLHALIRRTWVGE